MRCGISLAEVRRTTLPQARLLCRHAPDVDGHSEVVRALFDIVSALFGEKPKPNARSREQAARDGGRQLDAREQAVRDRFGVIVPPD